MGRVGAAFAIGIVVLSLQACVVIHVHAPADATIRTTRNLGLLNVQLIPGSSRPIGYRSEGLGMARGPTGMTLGYWRETTLILDGASTCQTILWMPDTANVLEVERLLNRSQMSLNSLCVIGTGGMQ
jgi:hypothetical protein